MLTPASKALNLFETSGKGLENAINKFFLLRYKLNPELMDVRHGLFVYFDVHFIFFLAIILLFFIGILFRFQLDVSE
jgi:hypothetical protein